MSRRPQQHQQHQQAKILPKPSPNAHPYENRHVVPLTDSSVSSSRVPSAAGAATAAASVASISASLRARSLSPSQHAQNRRTQESDSEEEEEDVDDDDDDGSVSIDGDDSQTRPTSQVDGDQVDTSITAENENENENENEPDADPDVEPVIDDSEVPGITDRVYVLPSRPPPTPFEQISSWSPTHTIWLQPLDEAYTAVNLQQLLDELAELQSIETLPINLDSLDGVDWSQVWTPHTASAATSTVHSAGASSESSVGVDARVHLYRRLVSGAKFLVQQHLRSQYGGALATLTHLDKILTAQLKARRIEDETNKNTKPIQQTPSVPPPQPQQVNTNRPPPGFNASRLPPGLNIPSPPPASTSPSPASSPSLPSPLPSLLLSRFPLQRFLLFIDLFERFVHHAASGSLLVSPVPTKTRDFFQANISACVTFFSRIRHKLLQAAIMANMNTLAIQWGNMQLEQLLMSLSHVWSDSSSPSAPPAQAPSTPPIQSHHLPPLTHADLLSHRQLLETAHDLSQAFVRLRQASSIRGIYTMLRKWTLVGSNTGSNSTAFSLASLCFYLPAAELLARGSIEKSLDDVKRSLYLACQHATPTTAANSGGTGAHTHAYASNKQANGRAHAAAAAAAAATANSFSLPPPPSSSSSLRPSSALPLLPNFIALGACSHLLDTCHTLLSTSSSHQADQSWLFQISSGWDKLLPGIRVSIPAVLTPLLPNATVVKDSLASGRVGRAYMEVNTFLDGLTMSTPLASSDHQQALMHSSHLRAHLLSQLKVKDPSKGRWITIEADEEARLVQELAGLAMVQRLTQGAAAAAAMSQSPFTPSPTQLQAAQALTTWSQTLALGEDLQLHRSFSMGAADSHVGSEYSHGDLIPCQLVSLLKQPSHLPFAVDTMLSTSAVSVEHMRLEHVQLFRRVQTVLGMSGVTPNATSHAGILAPRPAVPTMHNAAAVASPAQFGAAHSSSLMLSSSEELVFLHSCLLLHGLNSHSCTRLLQSITQTSSKMRAELVSLVCAMATTLQQTEVQVKTMAVRVIAHLTGANIGAAPHSDTHHIPNLHFHHPILAQAHSAYLPLTPVALFATNALFDLCDVSSELVSQAALFDSNSPKAPPTGLTHTERNRLNILHGIIKATAASSTLTPSIVWSRYGRLHALRVLRSVNLPVAVASLFLEPQHAAATVTPAATLADEANASAPNAAAAGSKQARSARFGKKKKKRDGPSSASATVGAPISCGADANVPERDEDFQRVAAIVGSAAPMATIALGAVIHAINLALDSDDITALTAAAAAAPTPMPLLTPPYELATAERSWFTRIHVHLWHSLSASLPHLCRELVGYMALLELACARAVRNVGYAEAAVCAMIQAINAAGGAGGTHAPTNADEDVDDLPLHIFTLLTRFGGELPPSFLSPLLALPPSTWVGLLPQILPRVYNGSHVDGGNGKVQQLVQMLICHVGQSYPHHVTFPLTVALSEEEEWRRESDRCNRHANAALTLSHATCVTKKHQTLLRLVSAIDQRRLDGITAIPSQHLYARAFELFSDHTSLSSSYGLDHSFGRMDLNSIPPITSYPHPLPSTFLPLLSSVHRVTRELNRIAFLWEDQWGWELRRIQSELNMSAHPTPPPSGNGPPAIQPTGSRIKLLHEEMDRILHAARQERKRLSDNAAQSRLATHTAHKLRSSYNAIMQPLIHSLRDLIDTTLQTRATSLHELRFQRKYGPPLCALCQMIENPTTEQLLKPIPLLWTKMHAKVNIIRKQMAKLSQLKMKDASPYLTGWSAQGFSSPLSDPTLRVASDASVDSFGWSVDPPAAHSPHLILECMQAVGSWSTPHAHSASFVQLHSFHAEVEILRTKTRPKKLAVGGEDGMLYPLLIKNREDLHLDQRMSQVMEWTNKALSKRRHMCSQQLPHLTCLDSRMRGPSSSSHVCPHVSLPRLECRTFSVTPLSDKSGLIAWVNGVVSIFDLYKQEEARKKEKVERERANAAIKQPRGQLILPNAAGQIEPPPVVQPVKSSDLYADRLLHRLQSAGLSASTPRKDVPLDILKGVYEHMRFESAGVARDVLQREIWVSAISPDELISKRRTFVASLAVMSMVGYTLGLGDRHLGNIMLDVGRGDLLHIDFNISLETGFKLPIPEVVPFRLTGILTSVGAPGEMERRGLFQTIAETTLSAMREKEQTLTALLTHAFVGQPLAEWKSASSRPAATLRRNMDLAARQSILHARTNGGEIGSNAPILSSSGAAGFTRLGGIPAPALPRDSRDRPHALHAMRRITQKLCGIETIWPTRNGAIDTGTHASTRNAASADAQSSPPAGSTGVPTSSPSPAPSARPHSVRAQVELLIEEATKVDNLARLYEGWAPWV